jgi:RHS repeat-associated protein
MASLIVVLGGAGAGPSPSALAAEDELFDRPARALGEFKDQRTPMSRSWEMPGGRRLTQFAAGAVSWQDRTGGWHPFDLDFRGGDGTFTARSGLSTIHASAGGTTSVVGSRGERLAISVDGGDGAPQVHGAALHYPDVRPGVDYRVEATEEGFEQRWALSDVDAFQSLRLRLTTSGAGRDLQVDEFGRIVLEGEGERQLVLPAPIVVDSAGERAPGVAWRLTRRGPEHWEAAFDAEDAWLGSGARQFPLTASTMAIDYWTYTASPGSDCWMGTSIRQLQSMYTDCTSRTERFIGGGPYRHPAYPADPTWYRALQSVSFGAFETVTATEQIDTASLRLTQLRRPARRSADPPDMTEPLRISDSLFDTASIPVYRFEPGTFEVDVAPIVSEWQLYRASGGARGSNRKAFLIRFARSAGVLGGCETCNNTLIASSFHPDVAKRPLLEVTTVMRAPAGSEVVSPYEGELTGRRVTLIAKASQTSVSAARFQYMAGRERRWRDVPLEALRTPEKGAVASADIPVVGSVGHRQSEPVVWDLQSTDGGEIDGPVHVRALLGSSVFGDGGATLPVNFRLDRRGVEGSSSVSVGPGDVNLLSGEFTMSQADASFPGFLQDLTVSRTYRSRGVATRNADMFGPQWEGSVETDGGTLPYKNVYDYSEIREQVVEHHSVNPEAWDWELFFETGEFGDLGADVETIQETLRWNYRYAVVETADGSKLTFTQTTDPRGVVTGWTPDEDHPGYRISDAATATTGIKQFTLTEPGGAVATFASERADSPNHRITSFRQPGSRTAVSYEYEPSGNRQRLLRVRAPLPTGGVGRSLRFVWSSVGSPARTRVTQVIAEDGHGYATPVAQYAYDGGARLVRAWDPRISPALVTEYTYDADGRLSQISPPGETAWRLGYASVAGDALARLATVSRDHPDGGTATTTIRYDVPTTGPAAPYDLSFAETSRWGQDESLPWDGVAIFPPGETPAATSPDYSKATIHYVGLNGRTVNVASPGGHITTTSYDRNGNPIRELTAGNRERALAAGSGSADLAERLSTRKDYFDNGVDVAWTLEPETQIRLSSGSVMTGRRYKTFDYDQGAPSGTGPYHLLTRQRRAVLLASGGNPVDVKVTLTQSYGGGGWEARTPTTTVADPDGRAITTTATLHPDYPVVERTSTAAGGTSGPGVQYFQYFGIAPSATVPTAIRDASCTAAATPTGPSGFLCMRSEGTTPTAEVPRRWFAYNALGVVTDLWESKTLSKTGAPARHTATTYDAAGRSTGATVDGGLGTAVPATTYGYSATTGRQTTVSASGRGSVQRVFDTNGRLAQYTDASGLVTRSSYDVRGRLTRTVENGSRTVTYRYDDSDNLVAVTDPDAGAINATYDADGGLSTETLPGGLQARVTRDETGAPSALTWAQTDGCSSDCVRARSEVGARDADGRIVEHRTGQVESVYRYDSAGRLSEADERDLATDVCTRQRFGYDQVSNRKSAETTVTVPRDACGTGTASTRRWTHDSADRVTNSGWVHDGFGRATSVPAPDSGGRGALTAAFYTDDLVRQLSLDGRTHVYERDPIGRTTTVASTGGTPLAVTSTNRYGDDSDTPVLTSRSDGSEVREIAGPSGQLVALKDGATVTYQLRDLQGSIVATVPSGAAGGRPSAQTAYDPFGTVTSPTPNVIDWAKGTAGYGWLGAHQRSTEFEQYQGAGSPMEMGVRVYLPAVGRFMQVDPVDGGSANAYEYGMQDPANGSDLGGTIVCQNLVGVFCKIDDWIRDAAKPSNWKKGATYLFHSCLAGAGWGSYAAGGATLWKTTVPAARLYDDLRRARAEMDRLIFVRGGRKYSIASRVYYATRERLNAIGVKARGGVIAAVAISCIDGAIGGPFS